MAESKTTINKRWYTKLRLDFKRYKPVKERNKIKMREWRKNNKERSLVQGRKDDKKRKLNPNFNPGRNFYNQTRYCNKLKATPKWSNLNLIKHIYELAAAVTEFTGVKHEVDHIIPLKGKNVCGLHVEYNLQIIPKIDNIKKGNRI